MIFNIKTGSQPGPELRGLGAFSGLLYHKIVCCRSKSEGTRRARRGVCPEKLRKKFEFFHIALIHVGIPSNPENAPEPVRDPLRLLVILAFLPSTGAMTAATTASPGHASAVQ